MKVKDEDTTEGGRRRSGRLAKARSAKKNPNEDDDQQTPSLANSSQSNTPMASPSIMSPTSDSIANGENANHTNHCSTSDLSQTSTKPTPPIPRPIIPIPKETEPTPPFTRIDENVYLFDRKRSKSHKDKMVCDCILTKEERQRGLTGCGEDCLNRILMMECGSRCPVGNDCANKRFQKRQYVKCEPFRAGKKGWGLRVLERVEPGTFVMEYVGEVVNPSEFKSRVRKCAKEKKEHHYFMALKSDEIIDATSKGNMTRFINHSCEPTCETQKWTVNGDLRVGFFSIKTLEPGDEVTFNYQFERYGKKAQLCFCETPSCQGVIGGSGTSKIAIDGTRFTAEELEDIKEYDEILEHDKDAFEDLALGAEIEKLCEVGYLKNKRQVMTLARIMLRTEDNADRMKLLNVLDQTKEPVFRRLFIDYHGLRLLWSWMVDTDNVYVKAAILQILTCLPIPNRTVLTESKVLEVVERWSTEPDPTPVSLPLPVATSTDVKQDESCELKISEIKPDDQETATKPEATPTTEGKDDTKVVEPSQDVPVVDDLGGFQEETSTPVVERAKIKITIISKKEEKKEDPIKPELSDLPTLPNIAAQARKLLQSWKNLKEAYKIPRLIHKNRKDDELAADAFEEAEKSAKSTNVPSTQDKKSTGDGKGGAYDWILAPLRSRPGDKPSTEYMNQMGGDGGQVIEEAPKESKVAHRMNFEMELLKEKYERDMEALRVEAEETKRKLQMMEVQQHSSLLYPVPEPNLLDPYNPGMFTPIPVTPSTYPIIEDPVYVHPIDYDFPPPNEVEYEYDNFAPQYHEEWPKITVDNLANVVIECTPRNLHTLRPDEEAVVGMDYGVEYIPKKRRRSTNDRDLFDPSYPAPGMYFDFEAGNVCYTSCLETLDGSCHFSIVSSDKYMSDIKSLDGDEYGPLPRNWRRARDEKRGKCYFFHKKRLITNWRLPHGPKPMCNQDKLNQETKTKIESIVATADSTSCVGITTTSTNSPATSSCMNSPPGIFYKPPVLNGLKNESRTKETPDQSSHKKSGKRKKPNLEKFKSEVSEMVKRFLYPYQKEECPVGKIVTSEDFKHLCKKFTNEIYAKEVKSGKTDLVVNDIVKKKSKGYVKKYMATRGPVFKLDNTPLEETESTVNCIMTNDEDATAEEDGHEEFIE